MKRHERMEFKIENGKNNLSGNINKLNEIKKDNDNENH